MAAKKKPAPAQKKKSAPAAKPKAAAKSAKAKPVSAKAVSAQVKLLLSPLDDRLVVQVEKAETKTAGGLYIPESAGTRPNRGTVLAAGKGRRSKKGTILPLDVSVGDQILYAEYSGTQLTVDGREVLILRESDVLGVVE